ncbi:RNA polymerase sigma factor SigZ [Pectinatus frisingensis]|uniref:RNA polymerase sigma factor SigZ n=1 Tax=Pectinatus frisingensis TaxID=865 RepID=UPI0018C6353F|nr:RNA polymerase sigma factor SigZ [Pectinatus frisingensis]
MDIDTKGIWEEFSIPLKQFIAKRVQNKYDAEDILQDIFCKIHDHIETLKDESKIHAWVYQITRNAIIDYYRTNKSVTAELTDLPDTVNTDFIGDDVSREVADCLKTILNHLPEKYREAIVLTEFENLTQRDLAQRLGLSLSGAKSRVQRARAKLKEILLGCCHLEFDRLGNITDYKRKHLTCKYC